MPPPLKNKKKQVATQTSSGVESVPSAETTVNISPGLSSHFELPSYVAPALEKHTKVLVESLVKPQGVPTKAPTIKELQQGEASCLPLKPVEIIDVDIEHSKTEVKEFV